MPSAKILIQTAMVDRLKSTKLPIVTYDETGYPTEATDSEQFLPVALPIACNEIASNFGVDTNFGRSFAMIREAWQFEARFAFDREVSLELLIESLLTSPIFVTLDGGGKPAMLILTRAETEHPPQQSSSGGTQVRLIFEVAYDRN